VSTTRTRSRIVHLLLVVLFTATLLTNVGTSTAEAATSTQIALIASTGSDGVQPRAGDYRIQRKRAGWHTSTLYPASSPNRYNTLCFDGPSAIHGSKSVPTYPASHGCVRVTTGGADYLFPRMKVGDPVKVIGRY
jgi:lipoprotein-anchoring transpeptidase ErfK/SrfK